jgi:hypothetical protein
LRGWQGQGGLTVPGVVRQDEQKASDVFPWDAVSRSSRRKSVDIPGEDRRSEIDDPFPLLPGLTWEGKQRGYPGVVKDERTRTTIQNV